MKPLLRQFVGVAIFISFMSIHSLFSQKNTEVNPMKEQPDKPLASNSPIWSALGSGVTVSYSATDWENQTLYFGPEVRALCFHNNELYVGGTFKIAGNDSAKNIAKWDGNSW